LNAFRVIAVIVVLNSTAVVAAQAPEAALSASAARYSAGDFDAALAQLEPLLTNEELDPAVRQRARDLAARVLHTRGQERFAKAEVAESIADFDREIALDSEREAHHWQRGIAYYYAAEYERGAKQFELHQTVNPQDVENAAWHFLCIVRGPEGSVDAARKVLIPVSDDPRPPMAEIQKLFAGTMEPADVLRTGEAAGEVGKFYADLYVGLYYEALGRDEESLRLVTRAAENPAAADNIMGDVARVHVKLRTATAK
jgi:tetratricopeptide (TPR) repeat protein